MIGFEILSIAIQIGSYYDRVECFFLYHVQVDWLLWDLIRHSDVENKIVSRGKISAHGTQSTQ